MSHLTKLQTLSARVTINFSVEGDMACGMAVINKVIGRLFLEHQIEAVDLAAGELPGRVVLTAERARTFAEIQAMTLQDIDKEKSVAGAIFQAVDRIHSP